MKRINAEIAQAPPSPQQSPSQSGASYQIPTTITLLVLLITALVQVFTVYKAWRDLTNQQKLFIEGRNLKERDDIRYKLNHFFGPMRELRAESRILYDVFALKEKQEAEEIGSYFRTVTHLADGKLFSDQDQAILDEIVVLGKKQLELIEKEGWAVTNLHLTDLFGKLGAHIRILVMAYESKLNGMTGKINKLVFPMEIDGALETEIRKLQDDYSRFLYGSSNNNKSVNLDEEQRRIISYYDNNYLNYYRKTAFQDMSEIYGRFRKHIKRGALILDAGCGIGRDTRYFIKCGYTVVAFDASRKMRDLCRQYSFAYCLRRSFEEISFIEEFDAVWACASLVHLSPEKFQEAIFRLFNAVKPEGIIYFSLKTRGSKDAFNKKNFKEKTYSYSNEILNEKPTGRRFYYYSKDDIGELVEKELALHLLEWWSNEGGTENSSTEFINFIYQKTHQE